MTWIVASDVDSRCCFQQQCNNDNNSHCNNNSLFRKNDDFFFPLFVLLDTDSVLVGNVNLRDCDIDVDDGVVVVVVDDDETVAIVASDTEFDDDIVDDKFDPLLTPPGSAPVVDDNFVVPRFRNNRSCPPQLAAPAAQTLYCPGSARQPLQKPKWLTAATVTTDFDTNTTTTTTNIFLTIVTKTRSDLIKQTLKNWMTRSNDKTTTLLF